MEYFSVFEYLYRDADNYKAWGSLRLSGQITSADVDTLRKSLEGGEFFIAEQLGIPTLYSKLKGGSNRSSDADHVWHEFFELRPAKAGDINEALWGDVTVLIGYFVSVKRWNERLSYNWDRLMLRKKASMTFQT